MRLIALLSVLILVTACQSSKVVVDYDTDTDFGEFRSYSWQEDGEAGDEVDPLLVERVKSAIANRLATYLIAPVADSQQADMLVRYTVKNSVQTQEPKSRGGIGVGSGGGGTAFGVSLSIPLGGERTVQEVEVVIDFINPQDRKVKWRGTNRFKLQGEAPEKITEIVNKAVAEILDRYPPQ
ncbi:DUF4136 domain-containing protein [Pseudomaricurvus sp. HS19]|uniref:DUF4136 domain-containing protein n=1 Tax=Pseudomaricurvus sp. HS19 TaxID=2692626 RepID=UPI001371385A|nr:DUF4136 domain-containing protein [Pseudomaricurvus sp. HS19]MYM64533.1 DUF4136 domain-containing protein [Pseudomaricurvus sp. HS19]